MGKLVSSVTDAVGLTDSGAVKASMNKASKLIKGQIRRLDAIDLPDMEKMKLLLENPELVGLLEAEQLDDSALEEISLDSGLRENQLQALESLSQQANEGLTSQDKYTMEQLLGDVSAQERSQLAGIESEMARRGMESSGAAERAKREALQSGSNTARDKAIQMAAQGQQNRMSALQALGQQSGQMESQDFARQSQVASARDAIARANAANRQQVSGQNLANRQNIENQRVNLSNQQQMYNKGLEQQQFQNKMTKEGAQNVASSNLANMYQNQGGAQAQADANTMGTLAALGGAAVGGVGAAGGLSKFFAEDGGIARESKENEDKAHEKFKKEYMKRVRDELAPQRKAAEGVTGGRIHAANGVMVSCEHKEKAEDGNVANYECGGIHKEAKYASDGMGDIIDSGMDSYAGDRVDAKVNDGEAILNIPQQQRFMDLVRGKISVDELGDDDIIEGVPRDYRDSLHDKIEGKEESENSRAEGLKKLLDILGK